mmetsp:Transcript_2008/g.2910  ORF Transcript_2008/g.2910 Transcript_2008/m.2910 type:complete len:108 (-) Transcript_2008:75-398(-)
MRCITQWCIRCHSICDTQRNKKNARTRRRSPNAFTERYNKLVDFYLKKDKTKKLTQNNIHTYCQAFLCQPAVEKGSKNDPEAWKYVFFQTQHIASIFRVICPFALIS